MLLKLLVLGGNGFVGSHICREALDRDLSVASLSRFDFFFFFVFVQLSVYHALCIGTLNCYLLFIFII